MLLEWKKSGRSVCGKYQASKTGAYYLTGGIRLSGPPDASDAAQESRAICQRHAWRIAAQQAICRVCLELLTTEESGGAALSHALKVDSSQVSRWKLGRALVPARHCERIFTLSGVPCDQLRPDLDFYRDDGELKWRTRSAIVGGGEA